VGQATRAIAHRKPTDAQDITDQAQDASHRDTGVDVGIEACPPLSLPIVNILPNIDMRAIDAPSHGTSLPRASGAHVVRMVARCLGGRQGMACLTGQRPQARHGPAA
jgi:hypothetical protein